MRVSSETFASVAVRRVQVGRRDAASGGLGPELLLVGGQHVGGDRLPVGDDRRAAPRRVVGHGHEPVDLAHHRPPSCASAAGVVGGRGVTERARPVHVGVEQAVQRHRAVGVRRRRIGEVDDDAGLLAAVQPHDAADALLVDAAARRSARGACRSSRAARSSPRPAAAR